MKDAMNPKSLLFNYTRTDTQRSEQVGGGHFDIAINKSTDPT